MRRLLFALFFASLAGCTNKLEGSLDVDGTKFRPTSCRSLGPMGAMGVELEADDGRRFRFAERTDGTSDALFFAAGKKKGTRLGDCVNLTVAKQNSTVNKVTNVEGKVVADCTDPEVKGTVTFQNCH